MSVTLAQIAQALGVQYHGDGTLEIAALAEPADAGPQDLALAMERRFGEDLAAGRARAALLWPGADWRALGLEGAIEVARAGAVMPALTALMDRAPDLADEIHASAVIDASARIGAGARIAPFVVIGAGVEIGADARIGPHVSIGAGVRIGAGARLHGGVRIEHGVRIGDNFIAHANAVIGSDGFSFKKVDRASTVEQLRSTLASGAVGEIDHQGGAAWARVHSLGSVEIGDDVEIGASTTIDAGTIRATRIGRGTKIDNQVQIGHNVVIGEDCLICGDSAIAGSTRIGDRVVLGGACKVTDNIFIGDDVIVGGISGVFTNVPARRQVWGWPAVKIDTQMAINREIRRLPRLAAQIRAFLQHNDAANDARKGKK